MEFPAPTAGDCQPFVFSQMKVDFRDNVWINLELSLFL
jgi:hypothetical protein